MNKFNNMIKKKYIDSLKVRVYENRSLMGVDAARLASKTIKNILTKKGHVNIIFAAAPSQNEFLEALSNEPDIKWNCINAFHMDEYIGLNKDAPQGFGNFLKEAIFNKVPLSTVHYLNGNATDLQAECERYTTLLKKFPVDIVFMGIGENTHIAFNDPHVADFKDQHMVKVVDLDQACRQQQINDNCFKQMDDVPKFALTLTVPALLKAEYIHCVVPGGNKAEAVYYTLFNEICDNYPSTALRSHSNVTLYLDKESAGKFNDFTVD